MARKQNRSQGKTVWLVTWEWAGEHARRDDKVAAIFNPRYSSERVRDFIERLYSSDYSLSEKLAYALEPRKNPYLAIFGALNGHTWTGEIICGHNPFLKGRLVDDFLIERQSDGKEVATWKECDKPVLRSL
jgi:hypothetical protein